MELVQPRDPCVDLPPYYAPRYAFGEPVTRENTAALFIDSFAKSRGSVGLQYIYFQYLKARQVFDLKLFIEEYFSAGGHDFFVNDEKALITKAYRKVKSHEENPGIFWTNWDLELQELRENMKDPNSEYWLMHNTTQGEIEVLEPKDFMHWLKDKAQKDRLDKRQDSD